jgi:UDP-N-acetylglucosamine--N-acetylmuramyl-(pentapeptide) pyrophosphoryl-undecaprenol N-acetylglucosamine transferase
MKESDMRILAVGGGSGGHVTPVAAVFSQIRSSHPDAEIRFWCDHKFYQQAFATMVAVDGHIKVEPIIAGKLRRYHNLPMLKQLLQVRTIVLPNLIDAFKLIIGTVQSIAKLLWWRPDVVFTKGGFVCLPVGVAAHILRIPLVIHDSDAHPGLTNRILGRWADVIATGAPLKYYNYPKKRSHYVGIPVASSAKPLTATAQREMKETLGFSQHEPLVVITGGGLGAASVNHAVIKVLDDLLSFTSVALVAGRANVDELTDMVKKRPNLQIHGYLSPDTMQQLLGAADIVVSRAGATTLLELASLAKPAIIIPNEHLTGGHQVKNAAVYKQAKAIVVIEDATLVAEPLSLVDAINATLLNKETMKRLSTNIHEFAKPNAARDVAKLIIGAIK